MDYDKSRVILALDNFSIPMSEDIIAKYQSQVWGFKLNHNTYPYIGKNYNRIFCDYKLYDIPNTMCGIIEKLINDGCEMVTIHMSNNNAAIKALSQYSKDIKLLGVTILTSWDSNDVNMMFGDTLDNIFKRSMDVMQENNFYGMICSPKDIPLLPQTNLKFICPGIRNKNSNDDQIRTDTPENALSLGADFLVMGRSFFENT